MRKKIFYSLLGALPVGLLAYSTGPPPKRTGASADGGGNCTACHRTYAPANSDTRGSVRIDAANYVPGTKQTIKVTVQHPEAARWGFEITARLASDETKTAGQFSSNSVVRVICDDGMARGALAPCQPGQLEFAEHLDAPRTSAGAGFTFSVDWTPPATDVGDIVFYAAGNAANGDGTPNGDRIYTTDRRISAPCNLTQKPVVKNVLNGASFQAPWNGAALVSIFGSNFAPAGGKRLVDGSDLVNQQFPENLACIAVTFNAKSAPLVYVQSDQINLQAPSLAAVGPVDVVVIANPGTSNELRSDTMTINTQNSFAPAFFTFNGTSVAATSADGSTPIAQPSVASNGKPAHPGDIVVLYGTGFGPTDPDAAPGSIPTAAAPVTAAVSLTVGGVTVPSGDIQYVGRTPQSISGLYQVNVKLPDSLSDGDVPVSLTIGGVQSQDGATIPVKR